MRNLVLTALCLPLATGCFLMPKAKSSKKAVSSQLIDRSSIYMDRIGDGTQASLQFKTNPTTLCQMAVYSQDPNGTPTQANPAVTPCSNGKSPNAIYNETLSNLKVDTLYYVTVTAWTPGSDKDHGDEVLVRETPSSGGAAGADSSGPAGVFNSLFVARLDVPLKSAEIFRTALSTPQDTGTIKGNLTRVEGCTQGVPPKDAQYRTAAPDIQLTNLVTRDLGAGAAAKHPDYPERLILSYGSLNNGVGQWTLLYQLNGNDIQVPAQPISTILNMDMESATVTTFDPPDLKTTPDPLTVDVTKPLKFAWTTPNDLLDLSYVTVQIGRPDYDKQIYCVWQASKLTGQVDPSLLANLDDGNHVVLAELSSTELWAKDGWIITTYDWRSGSINK